MPRLQKILLLLIVILFLFTRFYKISDIPLSLYWDEASIGYNAYSISQDGKDEWGDFLPVHFRAFGEFKLPVYIYSVVPFVKIFGLNELSVRLPAILFSLGIVLLTFLLARKLTDNITTGLWSSFLVTISPWFFIFSRTGYEVTAGLMFYLLAIYLFLKIGRNKWYFLYSMVSFILTIYSYNSFRIISPITIFLLTIFNWNIFKETFNKQKIIILISATLFIASIIPVYRLYVYDAGGERLQTVKAPINSIISNYLTHFSPNFLIFSGDKNLRSQQFGFGQLYFVDLILIILGLGYVITKRSKYSFLILALILIGPVPAALTKESPHALRSLSMVPFLSMLSAIGIKNIKSKIKTIYIEILLIIIFLGFFGNYFLNFINQYPNQSAKDWQYAYKKIYSENEQIFGRYDNIIISDEYAQPYIFALFYLKYKPQKFRSEVVRNNANNWGFSTVAKFGNFHFGKIDYISKVVTGRNLIFDIVFDKAYEQENY